MLEVFSYSFFQNAILSIIILGVILPILGIFITIKRITFIADAFSHTALLGVALGYLSNTNTFLTSFLWLFLCIILISWAKKRADFNYDLLLMLISILGVAGGILIFSLIPVAKSVITGFFFGNILLVTEEDILISFLLFIAFLILFKLFWKYLLLTFINEDLAHSENVRVDLINFGFLIILGLSILMSIKIIGVLLVSALMLIPAAIAKLISNSFKGLLIASIFWSESLSISGLLISYFLNLPPGPTIAVLGTLILLIILTIKNLVIK